MALETRATRYVWPCGIGVDVEILQSGEAIGLIRILCHEDDPMIESLQLLSESELFELALATVKSKDLVRKSIDWQKGIRDSGHEDISPIFAEF